MIKKCALRHGHARVELCGARRGLQDRPRGRTFRGAHQRHLNVLPRGVVLVLPDPLPPLERGAIPRAPRCRLDGDR
ncbi:MAG: hypothetical protein ACTSQI_13810 [Candidatus Helarchaeota archaeon]